MKKLVTSLPKVSFGVIPMSVVSLELTASLIVGFIVAKFLSGKADKEKGILPGIIFNFKGYKVHLHHWFISLGLLGLFLSIQFFLISPLLFYGLLGGITVQGVSQYSDWKGIITRNK